MLAEQREKLHAKLWKTLGAIRATDYSKEHVLGLILYYYLSQDFSDFLDSRTKAHQKYKDFSDEEILKKISKENIVEIIQEKGLFIYPSQLFCNVLNSFKKSKKASLGLYLDQIFKQIEDPLNTLELESDSFVARHFLGLFRKVSLGEIGETNDPNSKQANLESQNHSIETLIKIIEELNDFDSFNIDILGDAYEYLINYYAKEGGKSGGEFFTPQSVSRLLYKITHAHLDRTPHFENKNPISVYDPCCGSGSLLLQFARNNYSYQFYGQEKNPLNYDLARMNMFLHGVDYENFNIRCANTLLEPKHQKEGDIEHGFDVIVSNPPFSYGKDMPNGWYEDQEKILEQDERFRVAGKLAPKGYADLAFILHMCDLLSQYGICASVIANGALYRSNSEKKIREYLVDNNFVDCVIALPKDLFFGTTIPASILILRTNKENKNNDSILLIDATKLYERENATNQLKETHIDQILEAYLKRENIPNFCYIKTKEELQENGYNLSVPSSLEEQEVINIKALNLELEEIVKTQDLKRSFLDNLISELERGH
ncbi:type I restriction-modification system subunit M [Helicobacter cetorum]|uniref:type I restriction-modification system subunit M n=1 Tax=Helicobacter cetorum TaxID=138563 RepID=UPI000CF0C419|nr:type I restriction-modification system subunit M [Helicobacter cetorum]